jgi:hypothetical protein
MQAARRFPGYRAVKPCLRPVDQPLPVLIRRRNWSRRMPAGGGRDVRGAGGKTVPGVAVPAAASTRRAGCRCSRFPGSAGRRAARAGRGRPARRAARACRRAGPLLPSARSWPKCTSWPTWRPRGLFMITAWRSASMARTESPRPVRPASARRCSMAAGTVPSSSAYRARTWLKGSPGGPDASGTGHRPGGSPRSPPGPCHRRPHILQRPGREIHGAAEDGR